jgi:hypothetical protein
VESTATAVGAPPTGIVAVTLSVVPLMTETTAWFRSDTYTDWVAGSTASAKRRYVAESIPTEVGADGTVIVASVDLVSPSSTATDRFT